MAIDLAQIRADVASRKSGNTSAGVNFASDAVKKKWESLKEAGSLRAPTYGNTPTAPTANAPADVTTSTVTPSLQQQLDALKGRQTGYLSQITEAQKSIGSVYQNAYEKIFGAGSQIQEFFNPALASAEQGITDVSEFIRMLPDDVLNESLGSGMTEAQARRITAKRAGELSDTLTGLTASYDRLTAGRDEAIRMGEMEYQALISDALNNVNATVNELTSLYNLTGEEAQLLQSQMQDEIAGEANLKQGVDSILAEARELIYGAGITPSGAFNKVIEDAYAMASEGRNLGEIQAGVFGALEQNEAVRNYIRANAFGSSGGGGGGGGGSATYSDEVLFALDAVTDDETGDIDYEKLGELSSDLRDKVVTAYGQLLAMPSPSIETPVAEPTFLPGSPGQRVGEALSTPFNPNISGTPANIGSRFWNWLTGKGK